MEYQKIINLIDNTPYQSSRFGPKYWFEINDDTNGMYNIISQIKFKTAMLNSCLCDYSDTYILVKGTVIDTNAAVAIAATNNANKKAIFKNYAPFTDCISEINITLKDNPADIDVVMPMHSGM